MPLAEAAQAHALVESGDVIGRIVLAAVIVKGNGTVPDGPALFEREMGFRDVLQRITLADVRFDGARSDRVEHLHGGTLKISGV